MPNGPEPRRFPCRHEQVNPVPGIEGHGKTTVFQNTVYLVKRGPKPCDIVVIAHRPPVPAPVVHQMGRVAEDEIHALAWHPPHEGYTVALKDYITEAPFALSVMSLFPLPVSLPGEAPLRASRRRVTAQESWGQMTAGVAGLRASGATPCAVARPCYSVGDVWGKRGEGPFFPFYSLA